MSIVSASTPAVTLLFLICLKTFYTVASPIVTVENGVLEGTTMQSRNGREFFAFQGIPYAKPPLGNLRFQPPEPITFWTGIRSAINEPPKCTQKDVFIDQKFVDGQEDCLYLNVYTPKLKEAEAKLPVMVWIHGGAWISGHGTAFGPKYFLDHDIVMVSLNYRLGALGFLSTEDMTLPGNMGMKDQVVALKWVQKNIAAFGGDPNKVTIFGESAGGASVHYHMMSPLSKGLFHRAISQSGSALSPWAFKIPKVPKNNSQILAQHLGCPTENSKELVECLRKKDAAEIIEAEKIFQLFGYDPIIPFRITVEPDHPGAFLKDLPLNILRNGNVADVPWMTGLTSHEGAIRVAALFGSKKENYVKKLNDNWVDIAPVTLILDDLFFNYTPTGIVDKIRDFYFDGKIIDESSKWNLINLYSDVLLTLGLDASIRYQLDAASSPVYFYRFAYEGSTSFSKLFGDPEGAYGVCHADELQYLFPVTEILFPKTSLSENDHKMIDYLTTIWVNFAKTGNPTPAVTKNIPVKWTPVRTDALEYILIKNPRDFEMLSDLDEDRLKFWKTYLHQSLENLFNNESTGKDEL